MKANIVFAVLLLFSLGCTSQRSDELTQQQKDQITSEIKAVGDSIIAKSERLDLGFLDHYVDSPDWGMVNADGSRWDYKTTMKVVPDMFKTMTAWKWTLSGHFKTGQWWSPENRPMENAVRTTFVIPRSASVRQGVSG